jgi:hypothetical protein
MRTLKSPILLLSVGSHHERAAPNRNGRRFRIERVGVTRFYRRLHQHADGMDWIPKSVGGGVHNGRRVHYREPSSADMPPGARQAAPESAGARLLLY